MGEDVARRREAALRVLDMLESGLPPFRQECREKLDEGTAKLRQFSQTYAEEQSAGCLPEAATGVFRLLRYVVCVYVLRMDREFVSLDLPKGRADSREITGLPEDSPILCAHRALDGLIAMLPDMRAAIIESDAAMTGFHAVIARVATAGGDFWPGVFEAAEATGAAVRYTQEDLQSGFRSRGDGRLMVHFFLQEALAGRPVPQDHWRHWGEKCPG